MQKGDIRSTSIVDGAAYRPKYYSCAVPHCLGRNLDTTDPDTQAFIKALDKKMFEDIGMGASVAMLANPAGAVGLVAGILGPAASVGAGMVNGEGEKAIAKEALRGAATRYLRGVYGLGEEAANRVSSLVDLTGGWRALIDRLNSELSSGSKEKQ
jgi:filamentous hemagglutinin